jgi:carbon-monoxide dehydrogenase medium subunit
VIPAPVRYLRVSTLDEALAALAEPDAKALAGGQSLVSVMKLRIARPSVVVDIGRLDLAGVREEDGELRIGALTTWADLAGTPALRRPALAALAECAQGVGDLQVRNRGTVGGSLAHADPASDLPAVLLAFGASVRARSTAGERVVGIEQLLVGPFTTSLAEGELLTEVTLPLPEPGAGSAYRSFDHPASGFALAGAAALVRAHESPALAVTGIGPIPFRLGEGEPEEALALADVFGDRFASADYRRRLAEVVARRALDAAAGRAEEDASWTA